MPVTVHMASRCMCATQPSPSPEGNITTDSTKMTHHVRLCLPMMLPLEGPISISVAVAQSCRLEVRRQSAANLGSHDV